MAKFNRKLSLELDQIENLKERITALENEIVILKQHRVEEQLMDHIIRLRMRMNEVEASR